MTPTEQGIAEIMSEHGCRLGVGEIRPETTMESDAKIIGIDALEFVQEIEDRFGPNAYVIPWTEFSDQRGSFVGCSVVLFPFWLALNYFRSFFGSSQFDEITLPQITVRRIAETIESGKWSGIGTEIT